jgi:biotin carboxylase
VLSIVSKGQTNRDLRRHPIYRLRLAPHPLPDVIARCVCELAEQAVRALGLTGVAECEMILDRRHGPRVLEVNPRISGTLRLSASASGIDPHRCLVDMVRGDAWQHAPRRAPAVVAQVPLGDAIEGDERSRLLLQPSVSHIKDIDWMPGLGVRSSVTVQAPDPDALCDWLQRQSRHPGFIHAAASLRELFDAQPSLLQESAT